MKLINQSWEWIQKPSYPLEIIEKAGRTCYKSEKIGGQTKRFIKNLIANKHQSVLEHSHASIRFITSRSVTHELVRHRLCSFSQESTRYVKYAGEMEFIKPVWFDSSTEEQKRFFLSSCENAEAIYQDLIMSGWRAEQAREVLPNALKTEIVVTTNLREWRHILKLRCSIKAHPQIRALMLDFLIGLRTEIPVIFDTI